MKTLKDLKLGDTATIQTPNYGGRPSTYRTVYVRKVTPTQVTVITPGSLVRRFSILSGKEIGAADSWMAPTLHA